MNPVFITSSPSLHRPQQQLVTPSSPGQLQIIRDPSASRLRTIEAQVEPEIRLFSNLSPRVPLLNRFVIHQPPLIPAGSVITARNMDINPVRLTNGIDSHASKARARENLIKDRLKSAGNYFAPHIKMVSAAEVLKNIEEVRSRKTTEGPSTKNGETMLKTPAKKIATSEIYKEKNEEVPVEASKSNKSKTAGNANHKKSNSVNILADPNCYNPQIEETVRNCLERTNQALIKHSHFRNLTNGEIDSKTQKLKNIEDLFSLSLKNTREVIQKHFKANASQGSDVQDSQRCNTSLQISEVGIASRVESLNSSNHYLTSQVTSAFKESATKSNFQEDGPSTKNDSENLKNSASQKESTLERSFFQNECEIGLNGQIPESLLVYEGFEEDGIKSGFGILKFQNGSEIYSGEWAENLFHGQGYLYNVYCQADKGSRCDKNIFEDFALINNSWVKYEGEFYKGKINGIGGLFLLNGDQYYGEFRAGQVHGRGRYTLKDGKSFVAFWMNNKLILNNS